MLKRKSQSRQSKWRLKSLLKSQKQLSNRKRRLKKKRPHWSRLKSQCSLPKHRLLWKPKSLLKSQLPLSNPKRRLRKKRRQWLRLR